MATFDRSHTSFYLTFVVTMAATCEIKRHIGRKTPLFVYPLPFYLQDHLELQIITEILIQTVRVPKLLGGAKISSKSLTFCVGCTNVTHNRRQMDGSCHKVNIKI